MAKRDTHKKKRVKIGKGSTPRFDPFIQDEKFPECEEMSCWHMKIKGSRFCSKHEEMVNPKPKEV